MVDNSTAPSHCGLCGNTHTGECHPDAFNYYQCSDCQGIHQMPFDACFGFENIHCCSNEKSAADTWQPITHQKYIELEGVIRE